MLFILILGISVAILGGILGVILDDDFGTFAWPSAVLGIIVGVILALTVGTNIINAMPEQVIENTYELMQYEIPNDDNNYYVYLTDKPNIYYSVHYQDLENHSVEQTNIHGNVDFIYNNTIPPQITIIRRAKSSAWALFQGYDITSYDIVIPSQQVIYKPALEATPDEK